jgi:hypothetical protein
LDCGGSEWILTVMLRFAVEVEGELADGWMAARHFLGGGFLLVLALTALVSGDVDRGGSINAGWYSSVWIAALLHARPMT